MKTNKNGNRKEQKKRRRHRLKSDKYKTDHQYLCIDGNWTHHPMAYCTFHHGVLTQGLIDTHTGVFKGTVEG